MYKVNYCSFYNNFKWAAFTVCFSLLFFTVVFVFFKHEFTYLV